MGIAHSIIHNCVKPNTKIQVCPRIKPIKNKKSKKKVIIYDFMMMMFT
jgi:hypothetical protein